jgi:hypothetical protein
MRTHCYFLAYRKKSGKKIRWDSPTGGLVMKPDRFVEGYPVGDYQLAYEVLKRRYHCGPGEELVMAEVFEKREMRLARKLCQEWNREAVEFIDLMEVSRA